MNKNDATVVIGAGPYGLTAASYLRAQGIEPHVIGKTMEFWRNMPEGLFLRSLWTASTLHDPAGKYSFDRYIKVAGLPYQEPVPISLFLDYCQWYQQHSVPSIDDAYVRLLARDGKGFHLELADGRQVKAGRVVVAAGISNFMRIPGFARDLPSTHVSHTQSLSNVSHFKGRSVVMIGNGQSALEYAALIHEAGASVEIISRNPFRWQSRVLYEKTGLAKHLFYTRGDVGPPGINWLVAFPSLFSHYPEALKDPLHKRAVKPAGSKWLRLRLEEHVQMTANTWVLKASMEGESVCLELSDGTTRNVDHVVLGTGYESNLHKLPFLDAALREQVKEDNGYPDLNPWFESSIPGLYFAGALAGHTFGPVCRFISGAGVPARQIARHVAQSA